MWGDVTPAERLRAANLVRGQGTRLAVAAEVRQRKRGRRAPGEHGRVLAAPCRVVQRAAVQLFDRGLVITGSRAQQPGRVAQLRVRCELRVKPHPGSVDELAQ